jgi:hypothetical protein
MSKLIHVAVKIEKCQVVDTIAFEKEGECEAFCLQFKDYDPVPTAIYDLSHALKLSIA